MNASSSSSSSSSAAGRAGNRVREYLSSLPLCTLALLFVNISIHIVVFLFDFDISPFTFSPYLILYNFEWYRIFSSAFLHGGIMHIGMNMMSLIALGGMLEPTYGTLRFFYLTWLAVILEGIIYLLSTWMCAKILNDQSYLFSNSIGYSGVLFAYAVIEAFHSPVQSRSVFGCFNVPTKVYPFVLLGLLQIMLPNISFFGHLAGLLGGIVLMTRVGNRVLFPSTECMETIESSRCCGCARRFSSYRHVTNAELVHSYFDCQGCESVTRNTLSVGWYVMSSVGRLLWNTLSFVTNIIGFPFERCTSSIGRGWRSLSHSLTDSLPSFRSSPSTENDSGYEPVRTETDSAHGVETRTLPLSTHTSHSSQSSQRPGTQPHTSTQTSRHTTHSHNRESEDTEIGLTPPTHSYSSLTAIVSNPLTTHTYSALPSAPAEEAEFARETARETASQSSTRTYNRALSSKLLENFEKNARSSSVSQSDQTAVTRPQESGKKKTFQV